MTRSDAQTVAIALSRIPRSGSLRRDLLNEAKIVARMVSPVLTGYRLGPLVCALMMLAAQFAVELLKAEAAGCDCMADPANGLYKCDSRAQHALTTEAGR